MGFGSMRALFWARTAPLLVASMLVGACSEEVAVVRWDALDYDGLLDGLADPNGRVTERSLERLREDAGEVAEELEWIEATREAVDPVLVQPVGVEPGWETGWFVAQGPDPLGQGDDDGDPDAADEDGGDEDDEEGPRQGRGTNVFVVIACPGANLLRPDRTFEEGVIRLESPQLLQTAVIDWQLSEDILLGFQNCRMGDVVLDGASPGYFDPAQRIFAIDVQLRVTDPGGGDARPVRIPIAVTPNLVGILYSTPDGTFTFAYRRGERDVIIGGRDRVFRCSLEDLASPCVLLEIQSPDLESLP